MGFAFDREASQRKEQGEEILALGSDRVNVATDIHGSDDLLGNIGIGGAGAEQVGIMHGLVVVGNGGTEVEKLLWQFGMLGSQLSDVFILVCHL